MTNHFLGVPERPDFGYSQAKSLDHLKKGEIVLVHEGEHDYITKGVFLGIINSSDNTPIIVYAIYDDAFQSKIKNRSSNIEINTWQKYASDAGVVLYEWNLWNPTNWVEKTGTYVSQALCKELFEDYQLPAYLL